VLCLLGATASPAAAAPLRVLTFGDSLSAGYGVQPEEGFAPRLEHALKQAGLDVVVKDASVSGDTTAGGVNRLDWALAAFGAEKPDLVIVELGANDMLRGLDPAEARANLDRILGRLAAEGVPALLAGMRAAPNLGPDYQARFDAIYGDLAKAYKVALHPFFMAAVVGKPELMQADMLHPNPRGVEAMVAEILPSVSRALGNTTP
jgi:acyl-CoA thioesterase I